MATEREVSRPCGCYGGGTSQAPQAVKSVDPNSRQEVLQRPQVTSALWLEVIRVFGSYQVTYPESRLSV